MGKNLGKQTKSEEAVCWPLTLDATKGYGIWTMSERPRAMVTGQ